MPRPVHVVCVGDSLTAAYAYEGYPACLQRLFSQQDPNYQWFIKNAGISNTTISDWLHTCASEPKFKEMVASGCDILVLMIGTNNAKYDPAPFNEQAFRQSLSEVARKFMNDFPNASVVLANPPPVCPDCNANVPFAYKVDLINEVFPRIYPEIAASLGIPFVDCFSALGGTKVPSSWYIDGVHMRPAAERRIASAVSTVISRCVASKFGMLPQMQPEVDPVETPPLLPLLPILLPIPVDDSLCPLLSMTPSAPSSAHSSAQSVHSSAQSSVHSSAPSLPFPTVPPSPTVPIWEKTSPFQADSVEKSIPYEDNPYFQILPKQTWEDPQPMPQEKQTAPAPVQSSRTQNEASSAQQVPQPRPLAEEKKAASAPVQSSQVQNGASRTQKSQNIPVSAGISVAKPKSEAQGHRK